MTTVKEKVTALKNEMQSTMTKSSFVSKVKESAKKHQITDDFLYWQANNDKGCTDKPWGKEN